MMKCNIFKLISLNIITIIVFTTTLKGHLNRLDLCKKVIVRYFSHFCSIIWSFTQIYMQKAFFLSGVLLLILLDYDIENIFTKLKLILKSFFINNFCINWRWPQKSNFLNWLLSTEDSWPGWNMYGSIWRIECVK